MPSGGGTSQTAVNRSTGARTQAAALVTAAMAVATMLFLAPVMGAMPNATLAAVVIAYSVGLISPADIKAIREVRTREFRWALAAMLGVVLLGTLQGILVAVLLSMGSLLPHGQQSASAHPGTQARHRCLPARSGDSPEDESFRDSPIARTEGRMYFGNAGVVARKAAGPGRSREAARLLLDCGRHSGFEFTALKMLVEAEAQLREKASSSGSPALNPEALEMVRRTQLAERAGDPGHVIHGRERVARIRGKGTGMTETIEKVEARRTRTAVLDTVEQRVGDVLRPLHGAHLRRRGSPRLADRIRPGRCSTAALGCNLAWGLVDAFMYLVRTLTMRGKRLTLAMIVRDHPDPARALAAMREALPESVHAIVEDRELETIARRFAAAAALPEKPRFQKQDFVGAFGSSSSSCDHRSRWRCRSC
jgi:MFS superfamily sulfate permease-like transporter